VINNRYFYEKFNTTPFWAVHQMGRSAMKKMSRRSFFAGSTALGATSLFAVGMPKSIHASLAHVTLIVSGSGDEYTYNGKSPGPTLTLAPGGTLDVELINDLPALHDDCTDDMNQFHGLNTTNLHTHGLHVSPTTDVTGTFDADNVFVSVNPKGQFVPCAEVCGTSVAETFRDHRNLFRFEIAEDHPSGTFWYHSHKHGAVQRQVAGGLIGPLIVPDRPGVMPAYIEQAQEQNFMMTNEGLVLVDPEGGGTLDPTLNLRPGEVQRWRIINAQASGQGGGNFARLTTNVPGLEMYQIAFDGLTLTRRIRVDQFDQDEPWMNPAALAPGNRMDLMVRVPLDARKRGFLGTIGTSISDGLSMGSSTEKMKLNIEIAGEPADDLWSDDPNLPAPNFKAFDDTPLPTRRIDYQGGFRVDNEQFTGKIKHVIPLGTEEEWTIENSTSAVHAHHIHVNPFFVTHINGVELAKDDPLRRWQDTVALPFSTNVGPGTVTYKTRFETFTGKFVIHCHILRHEDRGMMQTVEVVSA
tara:strand:- start:132 stop:1706 length:1575 start_codon:yes stop_codon:yes gene_type:complete